VRGTGATQSRTYLRRYFREDGPRSELFTGRRFERLAHDEEPRVCDRITPADVLALSLLSAKDQLAHFAIDVLEVRGEELSTQLAELPTELAMHDAPWSIYAEGGPADRVWNILRACGGKNLWVYANKLLARKRPHLLPAYDHQIRTLLAAPRSYWACLWTWLHDDADRAKAIRTLRAEVGGIEDISVLRCLDVMLWMTAKFGDNA
jgi:hypothetical protein